MNALKKELNRMKPKKGAKTKTILIDFDQMPAAYRWLERQAAVNACSKTAYVKALIEVDRKTKDES